MKDINEINIYNIFHLLRFIKNNTLFKNDYSSIRSYKDKKYYNRVFRKCFSNKLNILPNNKRKKNYFHSFLSNNYSEFPSLNKKYINKPVNKSIINNNTFKLNEIKNLSKLSIYDINNIKKSDFNKTIFNMTLKENKSLANLMIRKNVEEKINYSFLNYAYNEDKNLLYKKAMEDFHCIKNNNLLKINNTKIIYSYFAIFDGHGGKEVSQYLSQNFYNILSYQIKKNKKNIDLDKVILALKNSFLFADKQIIKDPSFNNKVGSTGTIVLIVDFGINNSSKYIICANVGDSKAYILSKKKLISITKTHNCYNIEEVLRVENIGGMVYNYRVCGTLMLTRSFGDRKMKKHGVISKPDIIYKKISENDIFIIIASDGVWDTVDENNIIRTGDFNLSSDELSKRIVKLAIDKGSMDNVSCILIKLNELKQENKLFK